MRARARERDEERERLVRVGMQGAQGKRVEARVVGVGAVI